MQGLLLSMLNTPMRIIYLTHAHELSDGKCQFFLASVLTGIYRSFMHVIRTNHSISQHGKIAITLEMFTGPRMLTTVFETKLVGSIIVYICGI